MKFKEIPQKVIIFLKEVRTEVKKTNWPTRQEVLKYTLIVIGISVGVAVFLGTLDLVYNKILTKFILP